MLRVAIEQLQDTMRLDLHGTLSGEWVPLGESAILLASPESLRIIP